MDIAEIILKKLKGELSESENQFFVEWLESSHENKIVFKRLEKAKAKNGELPVIDHLDSFAAFDKIIAKSKSKRKKRVMFSFMKYASIFLIFLGGSYGVWQYFKPAAPVEIIDPNAVTVDLGNEKVVSLSTGKSQKIMDHRIIKK